MADIFREVDEDVRRERYEKLWRKYGGLVIGVAVLLVVLVGGYKAWQAWDLQQRTERSDRFAAALELEQSSGRDAAFEALDALATEGDGGYAVLAALEQARLLVQGGDTAAAAAIWDEVAEDDAAGPAYRGLATILSVLHRVDEGDRGELEAKLAPLISGDGPYRPIAMELNAAVALAKGDLEAARTRYGELSEDAGVSAQIRNRATQILDALAQ